MAMNDDDVDPGTRDDAASLDAHGPDSEAVERDEELLGVLGAGDCPAGSDALAALLADWRGEVSSAPLPELPGEEE
ncbi:hypothetical protein G6027_15095, partial [Dietzia sp. SLG310A2-38A2]|nr:hypothetical protein [Dietzia sp. SLG310A2-38A2]